MKKILTLILFILTASIFTSCYTTKVVEDVYYRVPNDYTKTVPTGGEIEAKYLDYGPYKVKSNFHFTHIRDINYELYYPEELLNKESEKKFPLVVFVNGTAVPSFMYPALFEHLASWGFIAIGNDDPLTKTGSSVDEMMKYIINLSENDENSILYHKIDFDKVGITGHSQGGVGLFNAITKGVYKELFDCAVVLSPVGKSTAKRLGWNYDTTHINIPTAIFTGDKGRFETEIVIPESDLHDLYDSINSTKIIAIKKNYTHRESHYVSDGYVTAWLMAHLQNDTYAAHAFAGEDSELLHNALYRNQKF